MQQTQVVIAIQEFLASQGFFYETPDGVWTLHTSTSFQNWHASKGVTVRSDQPENATMLHPVFLEAIQGTRWAEVFGVTSVQEPEQHPQEASDDVPDSPSTESVNDTLVEEPVLSLTDEEGEKVDNAPVSDQSEVPTMPTVDALAVSEDTDSVEAEKQTPVKGKAKKK